MILIPRKRNLPHAAFPSPHPPTPLPHPGVNTALCGQFHGEGCAADMELCDKKSGGDWLFRWVEEKTYGGYFPQPILPIDACEHDPDDKVGERWPFTPRPTDGKATVPTHTLHYPVPSIAPPYLALSDVHPLSLARTRSAAQHDALPPPPPSLGCTYPVRHFPCFVGLCPPDSLRSPTSLTPPAKRTVPRSTATSAKARRSS